MTTFQSTFVEQLQAVLPADNKRRVQVWAYDESRFGLHTIRRRRITACGIKPVCRTQHRFDNFWLYGAIAPKDGDAFFVGIPRMHADYMQIFLDMLAQAHPATLNVLLLDNSRCHKAAKLRIPANIVLLFQPPYCPEVNPAERVWQALKDALGWQCFASLEELQAEVVRLVTDYTAPTLQSLTAYPYIIHAINALCP